MNQKMDGEHLISQSIKTEEDSEEKELFRKIHGILNKLTPQNFKTLVEQIKELPINTMKKLEGTANLIFERALSEPYFCDLYAKMCKELALIKVPSDDRQSVINFRKFLLSKCQNEFEQTINKKSEDKIKAMNAAKPVSVCGFVGELFKVNLITECTMIQCIKKLLAQGDEESLERACLLLKTIGKKLDENGNKSKKPDIMDSYFLIMQKLIDKHLTSSRIRFMLQDVIDLRKNNWVPMPEEIKPKTIDQIHKESEETHEVVSPYSKCLPDDRLKISENINGILSEDSSKPEIGELSQESLDWKVVTWKIPNVPPLLLAEDYAVQSPSFTFNGSSWILNIYFNGQTKFDSKGYIDVTIERLHSEIQEQCFSCKIYCKNAFDEEFKLLINNYFVFNSKQKRQYMLKIMKNFQESLDKWEIVPNDTFTLVCEIQSENALIETKSVEQTAGDHCEPGSCIGLHKCKVLQDFKELFTKKEDCDVIIRVKGQEFPAHRPILRARSPIFDSTFRNDMKEKATGIVDIEDCDPTTFSDFLYFLYCGDFKILSEENVFSLFTTADKYNVQDLRSKCLEFMEENLTVDTFCDTIALALQHSEDQLIKLSIDYFTKNLQKIIVTVKWQLFLAQYPTQSNELFIKALVPDKSTNT